MTGQSARKFRRDGRPLTGLRVGLTLVVALVVGVSSTAVSPGARAQGAGILPQSGALPLAGTCSITLDGTPYSRCDCRMAVVVQSGGYMLSELKIACGGRASQASALSALIGAPGRTVQAQYDYAGGSGMWVTTSSAILEEVLAHENVLQLVLRLAGPTRFENSSGRACVDGANGSPC